MKNDFSDYRKYENITVKDVKILNCINPNVGNIKDRRFNAICKCGESRTVRQYDIVHRQKLQCKKCGWKQIGIKKLKPEAGLNNLFLHYQKSSQKRKIQFNLTKEEVKQITSSNCHYCGSEPSLKSFSNKTWDNRSQYIYNTIDRKDSSIGYELTNCVPACKLCNIAKSTLSVEEYKNFIRKVYLHMEKKDE